MIFYRNRFIEIRKEKKIGLAHLGMIIGRSYDSLRRWERGERLPSESHVRILAEAMNIPVSEISDLNDNLPSSDNINRYQGREVSKSILVDKHLIELEQIIDEFGDVPAVNINSLKNLKINCDELRKKNKLLGTKLHNYTQILDDAPVIIYVKDNKLKYTYANNAFFLLFNNIYNIKDIIGSSASDIFGFREINKTIEFEKTVLNNKLAVHQQKIFIPGSNGRRIGYMDIAPQLDDNDNVTHVICTIKETTETENLKNKLNKVQNDHEELLELLEANIKAMSDGICIYSCDKEGHWKYLYRNRALEKITGYPNELVFNIDSRKFWLDKCVHPNFKEKVKTALKNNPYPNTSEFKIIRADGKERWVEVTRNRIYSKGKESFIVLFRDITRKMINKK